MASNQQDRHVPRPDQNSFLVPPPIPASQGPTISTNSPILVMHTGSGNVEIKPNISSVLFSGSTPKEQDAIVNALKTRHVPLAVYDAQLGDGCMEGTRVKILQDIDAWINDPAAPQIFWLTGMAGTGKTAIAWTICSRASKHSNIVLGGSFFCSRSTGSVAQRDVRCIVPTLAQLLARKSTTFSEALAKELARDPDILHKQVKAQIEQLFYTPLLTLKDSPMPIIFVIDALDECGGHPASEGMPDETECRRIVCEILEALVKFSGSTVRLPVKFLVTSRPEPHIRDSSVSNVNLSRILRLHTVDKEQVDADIHLYITTRLSRSPIRDLSADISVDMLVGLCGGLFIVAATALDYALSEGVDVAPIRFLTLLNSSQDNLDTVAAEPLDRMYDIILDDAARAGGSGPNELQEVLSLLAALLTAQMTLSITALADLLNRQRKHVRANLARLHAVVHVPSDENERGLRTLHASFGDYLFSRAKSIHRISKSMGDETLARGCLSIMHDKLHFNVSNSRSSYTRNTSVLPGDISLSLEYACLHWIYHVSSLPKSPALDEDIQRIFCSRFLFWLEVMSVLGRVWRAAAMLFFAASTVRHLRLSQFLRDAHAFVASSREAIERSAPHIYLSALPFASKNSLIWATFSPMCTSLISSETFGIDRHGGRLAITLIGHEDSVNSVAYSSDGRLLASGSEDGTVRVWDTRIGEEMMMSPRGIDGPVLSVAFVHHDMRLVSGMQSGVVCIWSLSFNQMNPRRLAGHSAAVSCVTVSPDGALLASASRDKSSRLWSMETGNLVKVLSDHTDEVTAIAFSHDGRILCSCSLDRTIRIWNPRTGKRARDPLRGHTGWIVGLSFSPTSPVLASASHDCNILLWDLQTGLNIATLRGHSDWICSVQFSPDGQSLVSASQDRTVRLWTPRDKEAETASIVLNGHAQPVRSVTFSRDGLYIASGSDDNTVRIWDAGIGQAVAEPLPAHYGPVGSIAISDDGAFIVSGSADRTIRVWDTLTGAPIFPALLGHSESVNSVSISSNTLLIASGSEDRTIRLWDAQKGHIICDPLKSPGGSINEVKFSHDALWLASACDDHKVHIWHVGTRELSPIGPLICGGPVHAVAFSPDDMQIASGDSTGYLHLWDAVTGQPLRQLVPAEAQPISSIAFSPTDGRLVNSLSDTVGRVWDIGSGRPSFAFQNHTGPICSVAYSGKGRLIASGSEDKTVRLWDAATGRQILMLLGHGGAVRSVSSTTDGPFIASCSDDRTLRIWNIEAARSLFTDYGESLESALLSPIPDDGWLLGPSGELRLWVPVEYRQCLQVPPFTTVIGPHRVTITIGSNTMHHGENWTSCWRIPPAASEVSWT